MIKRLWNFSVASSFAEMSWDNPVFAHFHSDLISTKTSKHHFMLVEYRGNMHKASCYHCIDHLTHATNSALLSTVLLTKALNVLRLENALAENCFYFLKIYLLEITVRSQRSSSSSANYVLQSSVSLCWALLYFF